MFNTLIETTAFLDFVHHLDLFPSSGEKVPTQLGSLERATLISLNAYIIYQHCNHLGLMHNILILHLFKPTNILCSILTWN